MTIPVHRTLLAVSTAAAIAIGISGAAAAKTSHDGWPKINGVLWRNTSDADATKNGTSRSDELLGGHGNDTISGGGSADVLWGDYKPSGQGDTQTDMISGGAGSDFIYASHGKNVITAGSGRDTIHAHFGNGSIDCGSGEDTLFISHRSKKVYALTHCEHISFKSDGG